MNLLIPALEKSKYQANLGCSSSHISLGCFWRLLC